MWHALVVLLHPFSLVCSNCTGLAQLTMHYPHVLSCSYKIEQELGTEIKPIPPVIEKGLYCA
jgi:hypothetical protein